MQTQRPSHGTPSGAHARTSRTPTPDVATLRSGGLWSALFPCSGRSQTGAFLSLGARHAAPLSFWSAYRALPSSLLLANRVRKPAIIPKPLHGLPILHLHVRASVIFHLLDFRF